MDSCGGQRHAGTTHLSPGAASSMGVAGRGGRRGGAGLAGLRAEPETEQTCFLPAGDVAAQVSCTAQARLVWIALEGPLAPMVVRKMGALLHMPLKQG